MADLTPTDVVSNTSQNPPKVPATSTEHQVLKLSSTQCEQVCEQICKMGYKVVALQIPRSMLQYSKSIIAQLREKLQTSEQNAEQPQERSFQVLADSSYSECCVDEVTAAHVLSCDVIVHFGHCCFNIPSRYHTMVVLPSSDHYLSSEQLDQCRHFLLSTAAADEASLTKVFISDYFQSQLEPVFESILQYTTAPSSASKVEIGRLEIFLNSCSLRGDFGRHFKTRLLDDQLPCSIVYFGFPDDRILQLLCLKYYTQCSSIIAFDPAQSQEIDCSCLIRRLSTKRSHLIERAKSAEMIGILIGTLSVGKYQQAVKFARQLIKGAQKKCYCFVVGKINVAKLANFAEIDAFVLVACAETVLNDHSEFYKPVLSLTELNIALNPDAQWDGSFDLDFSNIVDKYAPSFKYEHDGSGADENSKMLELRQNLAVVSKTAAAFLQQRSWQGLEQSLGETPVPRIEPGLEGLPMNYVHEPNRNNLEF